MTNTHHTLVTMEDNHPSTDLTHTRIGPPGRGGWNEDSITPSHKRKGETGNIPCSEVSTGSPQVITAVEREIRIKIILPLKIVNLINDFNYRSRSSKTGEKKRGHAKQPPAT